MTIDLIELAEADSSATLPTLRVSYDADHDFLWALVPGEAIDGHLEDETEVLAQRHADEDDEPEDAVFLYRRGAGGRVIGFGVAGAFAWELAGDDAAFAVLDGPRFDVPTLALRAASLPQIVLAARGTLRGSTLDVELFDRAVDAAEEGDRRAAEHYWRCCLECGEMKAHFGLGYTLVELGRPREAFGHLAMYTEICPRNAWAWLWRGRAAQDMGEHAEATSCYRRALACEADGSCETDAGERLAALAAGAIDAANPDQGPGAIDREPGEGEEE